ncbi:hypothetical protein CRJUMX02_2690001 [Escherichia coli]|nr:hypothetical protein CRJUMX02_2690001 [Escherichia coli]
MPAQPRLRHARGIRDGINTSPPVQFNDGLILDMLCCQSESHSDCWWLASA